jgi:hypothetical protein
MTRTTLPGALLGIALLLTACGRKEESAVAAGEAAQLLVDRNWLDHWPTTQNERLHVYRFVPGMGGGVYQDRTLFKGSFELFLFEVQGSELRFVLPDDGSRLRTGFRIERVSGPPPFDLRLTLDHSPRGPRIFYGTSTEHGAAEWLTGTPPRPE